MYFSVERNKTELPWQTVLDSSPASQPKQKSGPNYIHPWVPKQFNTGPEEGERVQVRPVLWFTTTPSRLSTIVRRNCSDFRGPKKNTKK